MIYKPTQLSSVLAQEVHDNVKIQSQVRSILDYIRKADAFP